MDVKKIADRYQELIVGFRRHFHMYPELGFDLPLTEKFIVKELEKTGAEIRSAIAGHGVVALLDSGRPGPVLAIRADMDALPIQEKPLREISYKSRNDGIMHACGHDAHMAILLGTAKALSENKGLFNGMIKFIFQPAEETSGGAKPMIEEGVLENPHVDFITGLHVGSVLGKIPVGSIGIRKGAMMAGIDSFRIKIKGKGGHASRPHETIDPVLTLCETVSALQRIVSREISAHDRAVLSISKLEAGTAGNIIPNEAECMGNARYLDIETGDFIEKRVKEIASHIASSARAECEIMYKKLYPPVINNAAFSARVQSVLSDTLGADMVHEMEHPSMGSEDISFFLMERPGCYFYFSTNNEDNGIVAPQHHSGFDVDESVLSKGTAAFLAIIKDICR